MRKLFLLVLLLALTPLGAQAVTDVYPLESTAEQERFQALLTELRCPKCQNQNIADSNAPIAKDMRDETYLMVRAGATNEEVVDALVARFGEFVRYKPQFDRRTVLLWTTPIIAILIGLFVVAVTVLRSQRRPKGSGKLTNEERRRAQEILEDVNLKP